MFYLACFLFAQVPGCIYSSVSKTGPIHGVRSLTAEILEQSWAVLRDRTRWCIRLHTAAWRNISVLSLIENNGQQEYSLVTMFSKLMAFSAFVILLLLFFSLHRNSPTFKSFEEKVENLKASREVNRLFVLSFLGPSLSLVWVNHSKNI